MAKPNLRIAHESTGLAVQGLRKSYNKRVVIRDVSITLRQGEVVALLGPNGSGKTTTFYAIAGLIYPEGGHVKIDGRDVTSLPMYRRAKLGVGYLPQEVLKAGYEIVRTAESHGIHDLDISAGNILTVNCDEGEGWIPKLYDFNLLPQHMSPPNPFIAWGIKTGIRSKSHRDYRSLKNWQRMAKNKH